VNVTSVDIKDKLVAASLGTFAAETGWCISIGAEPESPDTAITVYDTGGGGGDSYLDESVAPVRHPSFQVRVRSLSYTDASAKMEAIITALLALGPWTAGGARYGGVWLSSDTLSLGQDAHRRHRLICNFRTLKQKT
jgi:hypothetical protein